MCTQYTVVFTKENCILPEYSVLGLQATVDIDRDDKKLIMQPSKTYLYCDELDAYLDSEARIIL